MTSVLDRNSKESPRGGKDKGKEEDRRFEDRNQRHRLSVHVPEGPNSDIRFPIVFWILCLSVDKKVT